MNNQSEIRLFKILNITKNLDCYIDLDSVVY